MTHSAWYWLGVLDQLARENYENPHVVGSPVSIFTTAVTATVGMQVVETINQATEDFINTLGPSNYYQKKWWLLSDETDAITMNTTIEHNEKKAHEWPPFFGLRVELGGDST